MYVVGYHHRKGLKIGFNEGTPAEKRQKGTAEMRYPGEEIPEAAGWKEHVLKAHLNLGWVQHIDQYKASKSTAEGLGQKTVTVGVKQEKLLSAFSRAELSKIAKERGLPHSGTKKELLALLEGSESAA